MSADGSRAPAGGAESMGVASAGANAVMPTAVKAINRSPVKISHAMTFHQFRRGVRRSQWP